MRYIRTCFYCCYHYLVRLLLLLSCSGAGVAQERIHQLLKELQRHTQGILQGRPHHQRLQERQPARQRHKYNLEDAEKCRELMV